MTNDFRGKKNLTKQSIINATILIAIVTALLLVVMQDQALAQAQQPGLGSILKLSRASIPIDIPMEKGYENGHEIFFIATDVSDQKTADQLTKMTNFTVNVAPILSQTPETARGQAFIFTNGISGKGPNGFQLPVLNAKPGNESYSPLLQLNMVTWKDTSKAKELKSVQEIMTAQESGQLTVQKTDIIANHPAVKWDGGSMKIREDKKIGDDSKYVGGQVVNIDTEKMIVTMLAHRGWGPDGRTIYYIVTDATPDMPAAMMGVTNAPIDEKLATNVAVDLFQFMNGINGSGPMGFQAGIGGANPTDKNYSPIWKISFNEWNDPSKARIVETVSDIKAMSDAGLLTITPAMGGKHVVNCPFFDQSTVFDHENKAYYSS